METAVEPTKKSVDTERIAELEAELLEAKSKLEIAGRPKVVRTLDIPQELFEYDEDKDEVIVKDTAGFETFVDAKCKAQVDRDKKKGDFRNRVLDQVRHSERRRRSLSTSSLASLDSPSRIRDRSTESYEEIGADAKQSRLAPSQSALA